LWLTFFLVSTFNQNTNNIMLGNKTVARIVLLFATKSHSHKNTDKIMGTLNLSQHQQAVLGDQWHFTTTPMVGLRKIVWAVIVMGQPTRGYFKSPLAVRNVLTTSVGEKPLRPPLFGWLGN
jgi:hypothetical protein